MCICPNVFYVPENVPDPWAAGNSLRPGREPGEGGRFPRLREQLVPRILADGDGGGVAQAPLCRDGIHLLDEAVDAP